MNSILVKLLAVINRAIRSTALLVLLFAFLICILPLPMLQGALPTSWVRPSTTPKPPVDSASLPCTISPHFAGVGDGFEEERYNEVLDCTDSAVGHGIESRDDETMTVEKKKKQKNKKKNTTSVLHHTATPSTVDRIESKPFLSAFYIFGDSTVDCGNNNYLGTFARADIPPYGRDFDTHMPTGRFCNGRLTIDYLALLMGLPFVPTFLGVGGVLENMKQGVNFASAGAGVLYSSGSDLGQHISLTQQIQQASDLIEDMLVFVGEEETQELISKSVIYLSIGSNDYIHFYLQNVSGVRSLHPPWKFNQLLIEGISDELKHLYNANARKFVCIGMGPLGCAPRYLWESNSIDGECAEDINNMIIEYNFALKYMVDQLNLNLPDANIIFCNIYDGIMDIIQNPQVYGFETATDACCGLGKYGGWLMCISPNMACVNASTHAWWDEYHPTAAVNSILADNIWKGKFMNICQPMNLHDLASAGN